jgi:H+/gluconate symporter-like permease
MLPANITVSLIVVVIAFALFFYMSFKGVNLFLTVFACTFLVCLCTSDGISSIFTSFLPTVGTMFQQFLLLYTIGGAFGQLCKALGARVIGVRRSDTSKPEYADEVHLIRVFGEKWIAVVLFVITSLMMAAGVGSYQYAVLAISLPVLKRLNMPRKVALAAMSAGAGSVAYGILIGMPNALNIAPTSYLNTTTMAGPVISLVCTAFAVVFIVGYLQWLTRRCKAKGEGFVSYADDPVPEKEESQLPAAWKGYVCVAAIIGLSLLFQALGINSLQATVYAQALSIALLVLLVGRTFLEHPFQTCVRGIQGSILPVVFISIVVGYGSVVQKTPVFTWLVERVLSMDLHPYILTLVAVALLSGMTANGTGGVTLFMNTFGSSIMSNTAINLGAVHRIAAIAGCSFDSLPHNGAIAFQLSVFKLSYKEGYFQQFMMSVVTPLLCGVLAVILAMVLY